MKPKNKSPVFVEVTTPAGHQDCLLRVPYECWMDFKHSEFPVFCEVNSSLIDMQEKGYTFRVVTTLQDVSQLRCYDWVHND